MFRLVLQLALILSLVLNGISAPWAMARMDHENHRAHNAHAVHPDAAQAAQAGCMGHHGHHGHHDHHDMRAPAAGHPPLDPVVNRSCCDGSLCQCGCVLPPVLALRVSGVLVVSIGTPTFVTAESHPVLRIISPPLRPPAA